MVKEAASDQAGVSGWTHVTAQLQPQEATLDNCQVSEFCCAWQPLLSACVLGKERKEELIKTALRSVLCGSLQARVSDACA
jgi:hypothetical protein